MELNHYFSFVILFLISPIFCFSAQEVPDSLSKNANVIIVDEVMTVEHFKFDELKYHYKVKIKILNKAGEQFQSAYFPYKKGTEKISGIKIKAYDDNGHLFLKPKSKEIKDYASSDGYSIVTDYRTKHWSFVTKDYPVYLEYEYVKESKNTLMLPAWTPIPYYNVAVLKSTYNLNTDLSCQKKEMNFSKYYSLSSNGNSYSMFGQKAITKEEYSPLISEIFPMLLIKPRRFNYEGFEGSIKDWNDLAIWVHKSFLADKSFENEEEVKKVLDKFISPGDDEYTIAKKIYDYVQENTRYVSISLEDGGYNPLHPQKVDEVKYGDCKALSLYMKKLLELYDIQSNYVIVHAGANEMQDLYEDFPSTFPANHAILNIPLEEETLWVDCTSHDNPFNFLGSFTDNRSVLEINDKGGKLNRTPIYDETINRSIDTTYLDVSEDGDVVLYRKQTNTGLNMDLDIQLKKTSQDRRKKYLKENEFNNMEFDELKSFEVEIDEANVESTQSCEIAFKNYVEFAGDYIFLPINVLSTGIPKLPKDKNRKNEVYFPRGFFESHTMIFNNISNYEALKDISIEKETAYGSYSCTLRKEKEQFILDRSFTLKKGKYPASDYTKLKNFFDSCIKIERTPLSLKKI